jgi:hypothetical protein
MTSSQIRKEAFAAIFKVLLGHFGTRKPSAKGAKPTLQQSVANFCAYCNEPFRHGTAYMQPTALGKADRMYRVSVWELEDQEILRFSSP